jgi:uncharacterized metal-binding protein
MGAGCCDEKGSETLIFTCCGAAYSGQVSNRAGVTLMQERAGNLFCIAAVGAGIHEKLERARTAGRRVVIDGCDDHCGRKIIEGAGLPVDLHVDVTELGVEKKPAEPALTTDAKHVVARVKESLLQAG